MCQRIMIADDHPVFLIGLHAIISSAFNKNFIICSEATTVEELLSALKKDEPDVLLTDFNMPGLQQSDGLRLIEMIRRMYPSLPIIVVTSLSNPGLIKTMLSKGVYDVINKQSLTTELILSLTNFLQGNISSSHAVILDEPKRLSPRELEVVRLLSQGKSSSDIATLLNRTRQTISCQKKSAMNKIGVNTTTELLEYLRDIGI